jgi:transcriptional regulator with XRE-family HTH domain
MAHDSNQPEPGMNSRSVDTLDAELPDIGAGIDIGARLSQLRQERAWTLQQASRQTGVSASALSKIERNELSPTIATLQRVARGYEMDLVDLLADREAPRSLAGRRSVTRASGGRAYQSNSCANTLLCADLIDKKMTPIRSRVTARKPSDYGSWPVSDAEIFLTVVGGTVVVHSQIYEPLTLQAGDCLYYDASTPHIWLSEGPEDAEVIWVLAS